MPVFPDDIWPLSTMFGSVNNGSFGHHLHQEQRRQLEINELQ